MDHIVAGRFPTKTRADAAAEVLARYIERGDLCIFHNNPPGQHGTANAGGKADINPGAEPAEGALTAGVAAGVIGMAGGPVTALAATGVAAHAGSLIGTLGGSGQDLAFEATPHVRPAGVILAVHITRQTSKERVVSDLRDGGAEDIEHAQGEWHDGDWTDFDPALKPQLVAA